MIIVARRTAVGLMLVSAGCAPRAAVLGRRDGTEPNPVPASAAFVDVNVVPMDADRVLSHQTVVVVGGRITALGPAAAVHVPAGAARIDGRGKFLIPGLADMHAHLEPFGVPLREAHAEEMLLLWLANGVTTIRNLDYFFWDPATQGAELLRLRARANAGELWAPRMYTAAQWHTDTGRSIAENVRAYKVAGYDFIKVHDESGPVVDSLVAAAQAVDIPIVGHPVGGVEYGGRELTYALEHHFRSVEHLLGYPGAFVGSSADTLADTIKIPALVAATARAGVWVCPTEAWLESGAGLARDPRRVPGRQYAPTEWRGMYGGDDTTESAPSGAMLSALDSAAARGAVHVDLRRRTLRAMQAAGVGLLLGTDTPLSGIAGFTAQEELAVLVQAGLTPYQALLTGTRNVAAYFGTLDSAGTVAVGKRADLVLLTDNPLEDIRHARDIGGVMIGGRWLDRAALDRRLEAVQKKLTSCAASCRSQ